MKDVSPETQARLDAMLESAPRRASNPVLRAIIKAGKSKYVFGRDCTNCAGLRGIVIGALLFNVDRIVS